MWLAAESVTLEHAGELLSRYEVRVEAETGELRSVARARLFGTSAAVAQPRLFGLDALGETGWLKALRLEGYDPSPPRRQHALQQTLFPYATRRRSSGARPGASSSASSSRGGIIPGLV